MLLSGSVGYTLLENKDINKVVILLSDIHAGVSYCASDSTMIDKWLDTKSSNNDILLEEVIRENFSLTDLWPGAEHTQRLKHLNRNNGKIKPIDIRPLLIPYSWELLDTSNSELKNMTLREYLQRIDNIFNLKKTKLMMEYLIPEIKKLLKDCDEKIRRLLFSHFQEMRELYLDYIKSNRHLLDKKMYDLFMNNKDVLEEINNITSMIMEWYVLLLIFNSKTNSILHLGLAHSNRLLDFLTEIYKFRIIKKSGITQIAEITTNPQACLLMPDEINKL